MSEPLPEIMPDGSHDRFSMSDKSRQAEADNLEAAFAEDTVLNPIDYQLEIEHSAHDEPQLSPTARRIVDGYLEKVWAAPTVPYPSKKAREHFEARRAEKRRNVTRYLEEMYAADSHDPENGNSDSVVRSDASERDS